MIILLTIVVAVQTNVMTMNRKKLRIENDFIKYKKKKIPFSEVKKLVFTRTFQARGIAIYGNKKNISLYHLSADDYQEIHDILLSKLGNVTIKYPKRPSPFFLNYIVYAFFGFTLIFSPTIQRTEFSSNSIIETNFHTENYAFYLSKVEFSQEVNETLMNAITPYGKIFFGEHNEADIIPNLSDEILPISLDIDYLDSKPIGIIHWMIRKGMIRRDNPRIFYSKDVKAFYTSREPDKKMLEVKKIGKETFLRFGFYGNFSDDYILDLLESVEFRD
jgi:hypothetical protein